MVVLIRKMLPHGVVSVEASVVFAAFCFAKEAIPNVSIPIWDAQTLWSNNKRSHVYSAKVLNDFT